MPTSTARLASLLFLAVITPACLDTGEHDTGELATDESEVSLEVLRGFLLGPSPSWAAPTLGIARHTGGFDAKVIDANVASMVARGGQLVTGDFNGDTRMDFAVIGNPDEKTVPVFFDRGGEWGAFDRKNGYVGVFVDWARTEKVQAAVGDFDGDGNDDIALAGGQDWTTTPMALSNGDGTFTVINPAAGQFARWATHLGATLRAGDFDGDYADDLVLVGGWSWTTVPVRFSRNWAQSYYLTNVTTPVFSQLADRYGQFTPVTGDFNGDGKTDIALTKQGGFTNSWDNATWATHVLPVALSTGRGAFSVSTMRYDDFASWIDQGGCPIVGDYNRDGMDDIALVGGDHWWTVPVAYGRPTGSSFTITNNEAADVATIAAIPGVLPVGRYTRHDCH